MNEVVQPNTPVKFAARNMRPKFRRLKSGDIFLIEIECEEDTWNSLRTVPENALLETVLWFHDGDNQAEEPLPESKGEWGHYWRQLFKQGFNNFPDLIQTLECAGDQVRLRLHDVFNVPSLSQVSPEMFEQWCESENLTSLITLSRQARLAVAA